MYSYYIYNTYIKTYLYVIGEYLEDATNLVIIVTNGRYKFINE